MSPEDRPGVHGDRTRPENRSRDVEGDGAHEETGGEPAEAVEGVPPTRVLRGSPSDEEAGRGGLRDREGDQSRRKDRNKKRDRTVL